jgi:membrane protein
MVKQKVFPFMTAPKTKHFFAVLPSLLKSSFQELMKNDPLRMAGATAFFTTFALPPIMVILIQLFKLVLHPVLIKNELFESLTEIVGPEAVEQLAEVLGAFKRLAQNWYVTLAGFLFLIFIATTLFKIIKGSINQIWKIKPHPKSIAKRLRTRIQAVLVIMIAGLLFMFGIVAEAAQTFIGRYIFEISPLLSFYFNSILNHVFSIIIVTLWFTMVFRYLPDGRPRWQVAFAGAFLTALLFSIGKLLLHWLLSYSNINTLYGTSASVVLLLLFVFYSSLILYFGAAFTKIWGIHTERAIAPLPHAIHYKLVESEIEGKHHAAGHNRS